MLWSDKRGFVETEILMSAGFLILVAMAVGATVIGWMWGKKVGWETFTIPQLLIIISVEVVACYVIVLRMSE